MNRSKDFGIISVIVIVICTAIVTSIATGVIMLNNTVKVTPSNNNTSTNTNSIKDKELQEFIEVYNTLMQRYYNKNINRKEMLNAAKEAMTNYLGDKYTTYLDDSEYQELLDELKGSYDGIGVVINDNTIAGIIKDSPAEKAGLKEGDMIIKVNGKDTSSLTSIEIKDLIKAGDKDIEIVVNRNNQELTFNVSKDLVINSSVSSEVLDGGIGYIYIKVFSENLGEVFRNALESLEKEDINSLVIDVRDNAGGYVSAAEDIIQIFLEKGKIVYHIDSNGSNYTFKDETDEKREYPIAVIINENSASASEMIAAALKESYGAKLVGKRSYGKGKVQQVMPLDSGDSLKYTSGKWLTPSRICVDGIGLTPDYEVEYSNSGEYDSQLLKAMEVLK